MGRNMNKPKASLNYDLLKTGDVTADFLKLVEVARCFQQDMKDCADMEALFATNRAIRTLYGIDLFRLFDFFQTDQKTKAPRRTGIHKALIRNTNKNVKSKL